MRTLKLAVGIVCVMLATAAAAAAAAPMRLTSPAFGNGGVIPKRYTCSGADVSPPLRFAHVPRNAVGLALTVIDTTAHGFTHWTLYDVPPWIRSLKVGRTPRESEQGRNDFGRIGYGGPCPPVGGGQHNYVFTLYALKRPLSLRPGAAPAAAERAIRAAAFARATLRARFGRR